MIRTHNDGEDPFKLTVKYVTHRVSLPQYGCQEKEIVNGYLANDDWFEIMLHLYGERVLPFDVAAARLAGKLTDKAPAAGHSPGVAAIAIATTAESRSLTVLTHNLRHFAPLGISVIDPFETLP